MHCGFAQAVLPKKKGKSVNEMSRFLATVFGKWCKLGVMLRVPLLMLVHNPLVALHESMTQAILNAHATYPRPSECECFFKNRRKPLAKLSSVFVLNQWKRRPESVLLVSRPGAGCAIGETLSIHWACAQHAFQQIL